MSEKNKTAGLERHVQTIIMAIVGTLILWVGSSLSILQTETALLKQSVDTLQTQVTKFTDQPMFTEKDFVSEMRVYVRRMNDIEKEMKRDNGRVDNLVGRIRRIENNYIEKHGNGHTQ